ncbi:MAG: ribonuclease III domain-containing protein [Thermoplasmata archaeon]|nr:ribonuclease III domain-containing protein [Thermoplasmata archaeon]
MESDFEKSVRLFLAHPPFRYRNVPAEALALFCEALTHDSYTNEHGGESYERLEFLGDTVLEFTVCEAVYRDTDLREGAMTDFKQDKVANHRISERILAYGMDLDGAMRVGGGHRNPDGSNIINENMRADSMEAILAAIYLSYGMDEVRRVVSEVLMTELPEPADEPAPADAE